MAALEKGEVDLILSQADTRPGLQARLVARIFPEDFQLIARRGANVREFADIRGKRVGLAPSGSGQYASFRFLAAHYSIESGDIVEVQGRDAELDELFIRGEIDAVFRVRPPQNAAINRLVREGDGDLVPIDQAAAIGMKQAALEASIIPKGAYLGAPPIPAVDLPTVSAPRLMFARSTLNPSIVRELTASLFELRHDLVERMPLASFVAPPGEDRPSLVPVHDGARRYFDREKPNFFQENADYVALIMTVGLGIASWVWGLKRQLERARQNRADRHNLELAAFMKKASTASSLEEIHAIRQELVEVFEEVVLELDKGKLESESLQSFALVWNAAASSARDRENVIRRG
jgi:TRAP transporter TAXI family solute receptor